MKKKKKVIRKKVVKKKGDLMIHFMPFSEIAKEDSIGRVRKIMGFILDNKIVILQGKLSPDDEARLIENSMTLIGNIAGFQGIEIATISGNSEYKGLFHRIRSNIARILVGEQDAITVIGPASIVEEITQDPKKMELMLKSH